jgi:hypothetical protein
MKVEFEADYRDFAETAFHAHQGDSAKERLFPYLYSYTLFAAISSLPVFVLSNAGWWASLLVFIFVFGLSFYFYRIPTKGHFLRHYKQHLGNEFYPIEIEISETGIIAKQFGNEYLFGWENLKSIEETDDRIFVFQKNLNELSVPTRAFNNPAEMGQFVALTKSRLTPPALAETSIR